MTTFVGVKFSRRCTVIDGMGSVRGHGFCVRFTTSAGAGIRSLRRVVSGSLCDRRKRLPGGFGGAVPGRLRTCHAVTVFGSRCVLSFVGARRLFVHSGSESRQMVRRGVVRGIGRFVVAFNGSFAFIKGRCRLRGCKIRRFPSLLFFGERLTTLIYMRLGSKPFGADCLKRLTTCLHVLSSRMQGPGRGPSVKVVLYGDTGGGFIRCIVRSCSGPVNMTACGAATSVSRHLGGLLPPIRRLRGLL